MARGRCDGGRYSLARLRADAIGRFVVAQRQRNRYHADATAITLTPARSATSLIFAGLCIFLYFNLNLACSQVSAASRFDTRLL